MTSGVTNSTEHSQKIEETQDYKNQVGGAYANYVLGLLILVYMFNFIDRQILSILAEDIKRDLGIDDAQMGFLYGTAFAVFYAIFGIPLGRLADNWVRTRLLALGLTLWSGMTALSGFTSNFTQLALARIGVGIGEASASPCAYSLLSDYFPKEKRATVFGLYNAGLYIGSGVSLYIGALVVDKWNSAFPEGGPLDLVGWQAAFMAVGLPGVLLAFWIATLREPIRGLADGIMTPPATNIFGKFWDDLTSVVPPLTILHAYRYGTNALLINLAAAAVAVVIAFGLYHITGNGLQWAALLLGCYAVFSWSQSLKMRDRATYALIWGTPTFIYAVLGFGSIAFIAYAHGFWTTPYVLREIVPLYADSGALPWYARKEFVGLILGVSAAATGVLGAVMGGRLADYFKRINPAGRVWVGVLSTLVPVPFVLVMFTTENLLVIYITNIIAQTAQSLWVGVAAATCQDLVLPRMRGAATASYFIGTTILGLGLGPYMAGKISHISGSLAIGCLALLAMLPFTLFCFYKVYKNMPAAEASKIARAQAAGEAI
jgi:MFS family permease